VIVGLGTDIVAVARIADLAARYGPRFLDRCFSPDEQRVGARPGGAGAAALAARWAAKEAFLKALGRDVRGIPYRAVEVVRSPAGPVTLRLTGRAAAALAAVGGGPVLVSLSHEKDVACATVVIESAPPQTP
jgi:holo-[acyl-carrier protein] synthase